MSKFPSLNQKEKDRLGTYLLPMTYYLTYKKIHSFVQQTSFYAYSLSAIMLYIVDSQVKIRYLIN